MDNASKIDLQWIKVKVSQVYTNSIEAEAL